MPERKGKLLDKKLVHKHKDENVLVYNLRRIIPKKIAKSTFEQIIIPQITEEEKKILTNCYVYHPSTLENWEKYYILTEIPNIIEFLPNGNGNGNGNGKKLTDEHLALFSQYYHINKENGTYSLDIHKIEEISLDYKSKLLNLLGMRDLYIPDEEKVKLAEIFEKIDGLEKNDSFIANMYVDINHDFFFEHPNEHVPGVMVIEAARQFAQSVVHQYGKVPFEGMSNILTKLDCQFNHFLELNFPIKMKNVVNHYKVGKDGYWQEIDNTVYVWQKNELAAVFNFVGNMLKTKIFKRIRKNKDEQSQSPRFKVLPEFDRNVSIRSQDNKKYLGCIVDLSKQGFRIKFDEPFEENLNFSELSEKNFEFFLYFEKIGFVHGQCLIVWQENLLLGFEITAIDKKDSENLEEALKRCCYVIEERELL